MNPSTYRSECYYRPDHPPSTFYNVLHRSECYYRLSADKLNAIASEDAKLKSPPTIGSENRKEISNVFKSSDQDDTTTSSAAPSSPLASQAHRASDPLLEAFRSSGAFHASFKNRTKSGFVEKQGSATYDYTSMKSTNEPGGFWGVIARKAKSILDNGSPKQSNAYSNSKPETVSYSPNNQFTSIQYDQSKKMDNSRLKIGLDKITSVPLNQIGETIGNALEILKNLSIKLKD